MASVQETFSKAIAQLRDMTLPQRLTILLGAVLVAGSLVWMAQWAAEPEMVPLLSQGLTPEDVAQITQGLEVMNEPYQVVGSQVLVRGGAEKTRILADLQQNNRLPADTSITFESLVKEANPWISQEENQRRWTVALQSRLSSVLAQMAGVQSAHVFLDLNARARGFSRQQSPHSASVTLTMRGGETVSRGLGLAAARLVSGAVRGLGVRNVEVVDASGRPVLDWEDEQGDGVSALHRLQKAQERETAKKLRDQLSFDPKLRVNVQVVLDHTTTRINDSKPYEPVEVETTRTSTNRVNSRSSGQPGVQPNVGVAASGGGGGETFESVTDDKRLQPGVLTTEESTPRGEIQQIFAAINLSHSFLAGVYKRNNPDAGEPSEAQIQQVFDSQKTRIASQASKLVLPPKPEQVAVDWYYDVADAPEAAAPSTADMSFGFLRRFGPSGALGLLAIFSLFLVTRMARSTDSGSSIGLEIGLPQDAIDAARKAADDLKAAERTREASDQAGAGGGAVPIPIGAAADDLLEGQEVSPSTAQLSRLVEQVSTLIKEDSQTAASLVDSWIERGQ